MQHGINWDYRLEPPPPVLLECKLCNGDKVVECCARGIMKETTCKDCPHAHLAEESGECPLHNERCPECEGKGETYYG